MPRPWITWSKMTSARSTNLPRRISTTCPGGAADRRVDRHPLRPRRRDASVGIGQIPDAVIGTIKEAEFRDLGIQTELYGTD